MKEQAIGVPSDAAIAQLVALGDGTIQSVVGPPGTVVFFDCNTMHGSAGNLTPFPRDNVFLVYNSLANQLEAPYAAPAPRPEFIAHRAFVPMIPV